MKRIIKKAESLTVRDFQKTPVWEFINDDEIGETAMAPVKTLPVDSLAGRLIGCQVKLANGKMMWGRLGNVKVSDPKYTEHMIAISVERDGKWFSLARYHDFHVLRNGPHGLATFLGLGIDEVFPIAYNVTRFAKGDPAVLAGEILKEPREKLTRAQIMSMVFLELGKQHRGEG